MNHASLTSRYRPQTFAQAAGQEVIKTILSRASQEDRVAPAYLFSGTRGVGKTTLARVFAKALNCAKAPTAEPCNECESCRKITAGMAVDVLEMDGASNRGIEDAKRLREGVNYAPMEGRYKIFIIDEAHMLSRDAFNALLKTIEEPPPRVTFIMATTEPHKFPATIISRCQHFVFKRLNNPELEAHLTHILTSEGAAFEPEAVALIVKRAAGSVRDGMSLLGQVLALGGNNLTVAAVRNTLGLAGEDLFLSLLKAVREENSLAALELSHVILDQGVDMGFFLRELSGMWRNLFMLRQAGAAAAKTLEMSPAEAQTWLDAAKDMALTHIHACWQLTLEGQRRVLHALEPAQALELLLLNLTILPALIPVAGLPNAALPDIPGAGGVGGAAPQSASGGQTPPPTASGGGGHAQGLIPAAATRQAEPTAAIIPPQPKAAPELKPELQPEPQPAAAMEKTVTAGHESAAAKEFSAPDALAGSEALVKDIPPWEVDIPVDDAPYSGVEPAGSVPSGLLPEVETPEPDWDDFTAFCRNNPELAQALPATLLEELEGIFRDSVLQLTCASRLTLDQLQAPQGLEPLQNALNLCFNRDFEINLERRRSEAELKHMGQNNPKVMLLKTHLNARLRDCRDTRQ